MENTKINPAAISYITFIGYVVAVIQYYNEAQHRTRFNAFHLRQATGIVILFIIIQLMTRISFAILGGFFPGVLFDIFYWGSILFAIYLMYIGYTNASKGEQKELPWVGNIFNKWFASFFNDAV